VRTSKAAPPTLGTRALNRALLARQLLLERTDLSVADALGRLCGIQNQYAPNAYLRLWACIEGFRRDHLDRAYTAGDAVQGTLMRGTIHTVAGGDYHPMLAAIRRTQREWGDRVTKAPADLDRASALDRVRGTLADGPIRRPELLALVADEHAAVRQSLDTELELLRLPPSGSWARRRADLCAAADTVIRHTDHDEADALRWLIERYLSGFGPAAPADIASFMGMYVTPIREAVAGMELRSFRDADGVELLDVTDGLLPDPDTPAPVRFLPTWDAILLVHARRTGVLPEAYRPIIFHVKMPPSYPTVLLDGQVAATWRWEEGEVRIEPLRKLSAGERRAVDEEAQRLTIFHGPEG
jgi:hypothetical protein